MFKVIMAPTEGSDSEKAAISVAVKLAQRFDADLRLVRVVTTPLIVQTMAQMPELITEQVLLDERLASLRKLEALGTECGALGGIKVMTALEDGPVAPTLRQHAMEHNVDLIVMSSHSRGGVKRIVLGSATDYLIRHTNIPVVVVRPPVSITAAPEEMFNRILVPLDGSALAEQILPKVVALASRLNATICLLQVLTPKTYSQKEIMQPALPWWDADIASADACLARASRYLTEEGLTVSRETVLSEDVATAIIDYSMRTRADLIALATSGSGGLSRMVFGAVADAVTRTSTRSLLVFHPKSPVAVASAGTQSAEKTLAGA